MALNQIRQLVCGLLDVCFLLPHRLTLRWICHNYLRRSPHRSQALKRRAEPLRYHERMTPTIRAPRGTSLRCRGWKQEAALRMLMNNLDPEVGERPADLVV